LDGRYLGNDGRWCLELRIDAEGSRIISVDLHTQGADGREFFLSAATAPGVLDGPGYGPWMIDCVSGDGDRAEGTLTLDPQSDDLHILVARIQVRGDLGTMPEGATVALEAVRSGSALRQLGLEIESEEGVAAGTTATFEGRPVDVM